MIKYILNFILLIATISCLGCWIEEPVDQAVYVIEYRSVVAYCEYCNYEIKPNNVENTGGYIIYYRYGSTLFYMYTVNVDQTTQKQITVQGVRLSNIGEWWCPTCKTKRLFVLGSNTVIIPIPPSPPTPPSIDQVIIDIVTIDGKKYKYETKIYTQNGKLVKQLTIVNLTDGTKKTTTQYFDANMHGVWNNNIYPITAYQTLPINFSMQFLQLENEKVQRICLLYLDKSGYWKILKDIKNPPQYLFKQNGYALQPFGKNIIKHSYGYKGGEILNLLVYYKTQNYETHNLEQLLKNKVTKLENIKGMLSFGITQNVRPQ